MAGVVEDEADSMVATFNKIEISSRMKSYCTSVDNIKRGLTRLYGKMMANVSIESINKLQAKATTDEWTKSPMKILLLFGN